MTDLTVADTDLTLSNSIPLMLDADRMGALVKFSELMAQSAITVPDHLRGKPADCLAIAMQAAQWGMNPFAVAQKTHVVSGRLGYEAQLVNAVISASGAIAGPFSYEFRGSGQDLECRVGAVPRGADDLVWGEWLRNGDVKVRNSPLWNVNPKQQLGYLQVKNWARLYCPGAILGVYTDDELQDAAPTARSGPQRRSAVKQMGPVDEVKPDEARAAAAAAPADGQAPAPAPAADAKSPAPAAAPAAAAAGAGAGAQSGISGGQVAYLRGKLKNAGVSEQSICDRFQVGGIELLTPEQFDQVKSELLAMA